MTAVPARQRKVKDSFQVELDREISKRRKAGLVTGFSDDDYEDDFNDSDDGIGEHGSQTYNITAHGKKWNVPSYLQSDDDEDEMILDGSKFIKKNEKANMESSKNKSKNNKNFKKMKKQTPVEEENPLLSLLSEDTNRPGSGLNPNTVPRSASPLSYFLNKQEANTIHKSSLDGKQHTASLHSDVAPKPRTRSKDKSLSQTSVDYDLFPVHTRGVKKNNSMEDILSTKQQPSHTHSSETNTFSKSVEKNDSQSIIDMLLATKTTEPVPKPRNKGPELSKERSRSHSGSRPGSAKSRNSTPPRNKSLESLTSKEPQNSILGELPSLTGIRKSASFEQKKMETSQKQLNKNSSKQFEEIKTKDTVQEKQSTADDLLALFDQASFETTTNNFQSGVSPKKGKSTGEIRSPVEEVIEKTNKQAKNTPQQRSSKQLYDNVIENVAAHNQENNFVVKEVTDMKLGDDTAPQKTDKKVPKTSTAKLKSSLKSPRKPSDSYQGLGSLTAHKQLQVKQNSSENMNTSEDIRRSIYLNWLAEREKQRKIQKKAELKEQEKINEKKKKEMEEKFFENEGARNAWIQQKEEQIKETEKRKRTEARKTREQKLRKEEEKWKSQKKCDVLRKKALEEANVKHKEEMKKKREDDLLKKKKERERQEESKKAMDEWLEKRSKQWEENKKKEIKEKKKQEKIVDRAKQEKEEEGLRKYQKWRERKDEELQRSRSSFHGDVADERPAWSPANKIIPRGR